MDNTEEQKIHNEIIDKIKSGQVTMRSHAYWISRTVLLTLAAGLAAAAAAFVGSFIVFITRGNGVWDLTAFGGRGLWDFLVFFPWLFVPAVLLFVWLFERFMRRFSSAYRLPVLYTIVASLAMVLILSVVVLVTPLHSWLYKSATQNQLPFAGSVYLYFGTHHPDDFFVGRLTSVDGSSCVIMDHSGQSVRLTLDNSTKYYNTTKIQPGDFVEIVGDERGGVLHAYGISKISPNNKFLFKQDFKNDDDIDPVSGETP